MKPKILVTAYQNPDLDGTACAFAYSEFLKKKGEDAVAGIFGTIHREAQFVFDEFGISKMKNAEKLVEKYENIVLVDSSDLKGISKEIDPSKVVGIIDHRKINQANKFPNAKVQIELVGSAATLIAEKFYKNKIEISKESAALLYSSIVSNTVNFQANVTTERDRKMAKWLKNHLSLPKNYIHEMFEHKSNFDKPLKDVFLNDFAYFDFKTKIGIVQLEIVKVDDFIKNNFDSILKALDEIKQQNALDVMFLSCIDVEKAFNKFVIIDKKSEELVTKIFNIKFENNVAKRNAIIMRKEIVPLIKGFLEVKS